MPRNKVRKSDKGLFDSEVMKAAVAEVVAKGKSVRAVAKDFKLSRTTLTRYVNDAKEATAGEPEMCFKKSRVTTQVFTNAEERLLVDYIINCSKMFHGLSIRATRKLALDYAIQNNKQYPTSWDEKGEAGVDWFYGLMKRHKQLSIRMPEATSLARACAFNRYNVETFFNNYENIISRENFTLDPNRLWNLDETGIRTVPSTTRIIAEKGVKQVGLLTSAEKGNLVTMCAVVSATGNALPPAYIFPRVHFKDHMLHGAPNGSKGFANASGWMNRDLFPQVLEHFIGLMNISPQTPRLIVMDNHDSHVTIDVIDLARRSGLFILTFPPHCSHRMQPLDVSVFSAFKAYYNQSCTEYLLSHREKGVTIYDVAAISATPFYKAFTPENIQAGFRKTGIYPLNRNIFPNDAFISAQPSDRPLPEQHPSTSVEPEPSTPGPSTPGPTTPEPTTPGPTTPGPTTPGPSTPGPSASSSTRIVTPEEVRPYPSAQPRPGGTKPRTKKHSAIITDTPERVKALDRENKKPGAAKRKILPQETELPSSSSSSSELSGSSDSEVEEEKNPAVGDFVVTEFPKGKDKMNYVGKIVGVDDDDDFEIKFLKKSNKTDNFYYTDEVCSVSAGNIVCVLDPPKEQKGQTNRQKTALQFDRSFGHFNMI